jgi:hypothetical protein
MTANTTNTDYYDKFLKEMLAAQDMRWDLCSLLGKLTVTNPEIAQELKETLDKHSKRSSL